MILKWIISIVSLILSIPLLIPIVRILITIAPEVKKNIVYGLSKKVNIQEEYDIILKEITEDLTKDLEKAAYAVPKFDIFKQHVELITNAGFNETLNIGISYVNINPNDYDELRKVQLMYFEELREKFWLNSCNFQSKPCYIANNETLIVEFYFSFLKKKQLELVEEYSYERQEKWWNWWEFMTVRKTKTKKLRDKFLKKRQKKKKKHKNKSSKTADK